MKTIHFEIDYHTQWGEHLVVIYSVDGARAVKLPLETNDGMSWTASAKIPASARHIRHAYTVTDDNGRVLRTEFNRWRIFHFNHRSEVYFSDAWADDTLPGFYHRVAFSQCLMLPPEVEQPRIEQASASSLLLLHAAPPPAGQVWAVVGGSKAWGEWNAAKARPMQRTGTYEWCLPLTRSDFEQGEHYKYVLIDTMNPDHVLWEDGDDRNLRVGWVPGNACLVRQDERPHLSLPAWKGTGCVIPVFSLRSEGSFGVGDFGDLKKFVRWAADTGLKAVQLLPINDTTRSGSWHDSYPYNGISVFALHPIYLDPREWKQAKAFDRYAEEGRRLNALPELDYEGAFRLKQDFLHDLYAEIGAETKRSSAYKLFVNDNDYWLAPYTLFCALRDHFHTANFRHWPVGKEATEKDVPGLEEARSFHRFVQFLLHRQMERTHTEARRLGVLLKGDIPIGVSPDSVPAWTDGHLFHFDGSAGAPPDAFAVNGQNWGFPTYNWDEMAKDGYLWWRRRLGHMEKYFDAYRIDHVLGFFRIWEIPTTQIYGVLGHFRPALPLSAEEIRQYGFTGDAARLSQPQVAAPRMEKYIEKFGLPQLMRYFVKEGDTYLLKPAYVSQRAILEQVPEGKFRDFLVQTVAEVLFVNDPDEPQRFHPRVGAQTTALFRELPREQRDAFNRLHDDFFYNRHNQFWADEAMKKIPIVTSSSDNLHPTFSLYPLQGEGMLACAEDLGMVPASVKGVLNRLDILSLEIQRMPKEYGVRFADLSHNPYLSVATIATHDMPPFRLWWQQDREQTQAFWREALGHSGEAPQDATPEVCEEVVSRHIQSPSMLCLLALQDLLAISPTLRSPYPEKEQINDPANPNQNWCYRMHLTIEALIQASAFNEKLRDIIKRAEHSA